MPTMTKTHSWRVGDRGRSAAAAEAEGEPTHDKCGSDVHDTVELTSVSSPRRSLNMDPLLDPLRVTREPSRAGLTSMTTTKP